MTPYTTVSPTLMLRIAEARIAFNKVERLGSTSFATEYTMASVRAAAEELRGLLDGILDELPAPPVAEEPAMVLPLKRRK